MKKFKQIIKKNLFGFILGIILASSIGVYAATTLASSSVAYDNSVSGGSSTNVKGALDELYKKSKDRFPPESNFANKILANNTVVSTAPTLTTTSGAAGDENGLYKSTATNSGSPTYYFRGNIENNYVEFAGLTWRIVRINEDGTIKIILSDTINNNKVYSFGSSTSYTTLYYSTSPNVKNAVDEWYNVNIIEQGYSNKVANGNYFCEAARVGYSNTDTLEKVTVEAYSSYKPVFSCEEDANGYGFVNESVGLLTYDEVMFAGGYPFVVDNSFYLYNGKNWWTMSPGYIHSQYSYPLEWYVSTSSGLHYTYYNNTLRPVINLKADVSVTGTGVVGDEYVVQ